MVATNRKYEILDPETGALDRRIFVDQTIYEEEMEKIFGRAWLLVAHESLVPKNNDFFLSYMGEDPVIVTRDGKGTIHVLLNMCRHRGNRVMRADCGNRETFLCSYHGWTFANDGSLNHVPSEANAYYAELDKEVLGLIEARMEVYAGLIFACWDKEAPSLEDYLGDARFYLDAAFNRSDAGLIALGPEKWIEPVNWKTAVDNCSDNYHLPVTHRSSEVAKNRIFGLPMSRLEAQVSDPASHHVFVNGHSVTFQELEEPHRISQSSSTPFFYGVPEEHKELWEQYRREKAEEAARRLGSRVNFRLGNHSLFPNTVLGLRLAHPRGPLKTEFWNFALVMGKDAPEPLKKAARALNWMPAGGPAAMFEQDDIDNWSQVTFSGKGAVGRKVLADLSMGLGHTTLKEEWPGRHSEKYISENNQRNFYARWMEFMNSESWADIHLEPRTASFDGEASFHG